MSRAGSKTQLAANLSTLSIKYYFRKEAIETQSMINIRHTDTSESLEQREFRDERRKKREREMGGDTGLGFLRQATDLRFFRSLGIKSKNITTFTENANP